MNVLGKDLIFNLIIVLLVRTILTQEIVFLFTIRTQMPFGEGGHV